MYFASCNAAPIVTGLYLKITNSTENHNGFQYSDGLNVLKEKFNDDPYKSCCPGGLYFTNVENIFKFLGYGVYLREIILPTDNRDFHMIKDPKGDKWRANMIILGARYNLDNIDTFKLLMENGADIHIQDDHALKWSAERGYSNIVKILIENGANIHAQDDYALRWSARKGQLDVVKFLIENGANIHADYDYALRWSKKNHLDVYNLLIEHIKKIDL